MGAQKQTRGGLEGAGTAWGGGLIHQNPSTAPRPDPGRQRHWGTADGRYNHPPNGRGRRSHERRWGARVAVESNGVGTTGHARPTPTHLSKLTQIAGYCGVGLPGKSARLSQHIVLRSVACFFFFSLLGGDSGATGGFSPHPVISGAGAAVGIAGAPAAATFGITSQLAPFVLGLQLNLSPQR